MNKVIISGNLVKDAELTYTQGKGTAKLSFTVANNEGFEDNKKTTFVNCIIWGKSAKNLSQYLTKGKKILVNGKLDIRSYEDKEGNKRYITEVVADMYNGIEFMGGNGEKKEADSNNNLGMNGIVEECEDDEMPF